MNSDRLRVVRIVEGTSVDGPGLRTSIYFAGCSHRCPGCHNPQTWDFEAGEEMSVEELMSAVDDDGFNVTLTGGDPLQQPNREAMAGLCRRLHERGYTIWCYTGYRYEDIVDDEALKPILSHIDVLVDGEFRQELRDVGLRFRGSSNQRLIDLRRSRRGAVVEWSD